MWLCVQFSGPEHCMCSFRLPEHCMWNIQSSGRHCFGRKCIEFLPTGIVCNIVRGRKSTFWCCLFPFEVQNCCLLWLNENTNITSTDCISVHRTRMGSGLRVKRSMYLYRHCFSAVTSRMELNGIGPYIHSMINLVSTVLVFIFLVEI